MAYGSGESQREYARLLSTAPNKAQIQELQSLLSFRGRKELSGLKLFDKDESRRWDWTKDTTESLLYLHPTKPPNTGSLWVGLKRLLDNEEMHRRIYGCLSAFRSELSKSFPEFAVPRSWDTGTTLSRYSSSSYSQRGASRDRGSGARAPSRRVFCGNPASVR